MACILDTNMSRHLYILETAGFLFCLEFTVEIVTILRHMKSF